MKTRAFVSFDLDHDTDLKVRLCEEAESPNSRVDVSDWSFREVAPDWDEKLRKRLSNVDLVLVVCGAYTDRAANVNAELALAVAADVPYMLLDGRPALAQRPNAARETHRLMEWNRHLLTTLGTMAGAEKFAESTDDNWLPRAKVGSRRGRRG